MSACRPLVAAAAIVLVVHLPANAGLPAWAKPIAESAPAVPEASPLWPSRVLFSETRLVVDPEGGTWRVVKRRAEQFLSNRVDDTTFGFFQFNDDMKVKRSKGWHVPRGERADRDLGGAVDITLTDVFLTDRKVRAVALEGVKKASLVFYEFEAERKPYTLTDAFALGDPAVPVDEERVVVETPPGWGLRYAWLRAEGSPPARVANTWTFKVPAWVPAETERLAPDPADLAFRLVIALEPPSGVTTPVPPLPDWNAFGRWFQKVAAGRDAADAAIAKASQQALAKAGPDPLARIRAEALFVRDNVRYLSRAVGIGGYTPRIASETLAALYGDCKDKGTLFRSMLASAGFTSYPILINATAPETVADAVPDPGSFDHFVVGVRWPDGATIPEGVESAMLDVDGIGKVLVVDTTNEYAWPGTLGPTLAGRRGALIAPDRTALVTMPKGSPATNRIERTAEVSVLPSGGATIQLATTYVGGPAETARRAFATSVADRRKLVESAVRNEWSGAEIADYAAEPQTADGAYRESIKLSLPPGSAALQDGVLPVFGGVAGDLFRVPVTKRHVPIDYGYPERVTYAATFRGLPETDAVPPPIEAAGDGWGVKTQIGREGDVVRGAWTFERARSRFEPAEFAEAKKMWSAVSKAASAAVYVRAPAP
jgi:hypothetical protein